MARWWRPRSSRRWRARGGRVVALERYPLDPARMAGAGASASRRRRAAPTRCSFPTAPTRCRRWCRRWPPPASNLKRVQLLGTGLWDDPRIFTDAALHGGWYAAPDAAGFRNFSARYRARYGQDPVRTATLAYDAVALVAALVKTQGAAALLRAGADQFVGLCRHRRRCSASAPTAPTSAASRCCA